MWALAATVATLNASENLPTSLLTPMAAGLGASEGLIGQSVTASAVVAILTSLFIAPATRRFDRRTVLVVVATAQVVSNLVVALAPNATTMLVGRLLLGLTVGGVWGLSASLALRLVPGPSVARALSIIFGGGSLAMIAAAPIGAFLGGLIGWRGVFLGATALAAVAVVALARTLPTLPARVSSAGSGMGATLRLPGLLAGMAGVVLLFGGQLIFVTYLRPYLEVVGGFASNGVALALLVFGAASFVGTLVAPMLLARTIRLTLTGVAAVQAVALALLFGFGGQDQLLLLVQIGLWGVAVGAVGVGWSTWLARTYPDHAESGGGLLVAAIQGSKMVGAVVGGALIDSAGPTGPLGAAIVILAIAAVHTSIALRSRQARPQPVALARVDA